MNDSKSLILALAFIVFLVGTIEYIITGIIEMIANDLQVSTANIGLLVTLFALSAAIFSPVLIALTIHIERRKLLTISFIIFILSNMIFFFPVSYDVLLMVRIIQGASGGVVTVIAMAIATRLVEPNKKGYAIGIILMGLSGSLVFGVPIGTFFSELFHWRLLFIIISFISLLPLIYTLLKLQRMPSIESMSLTSQLSIMKNKKVLLALFVTLLYISSYSTFFTYITPYLQAAFSLSMTTISLILFIAGLFSFYGSKLGGRLTDSKGAKWTIVVSLFVQAITLLFFSISLFNLLVFLATFALFMLATWCISPAQQFTLIHLVPSSPDLALSLNTSFIQFGFALGSFIGSFAITHISVLHVNSISFIFSFIAFILAFSLFTKRKTVD